MVDNSVLSGHAEAADRGWRVHVEPDPWQAGRHFRPAPAAEGECQVGRQVDECAGSAGVEHHPAAKAGVQQSQWQAQGRQTGTILPIAGERRQDDREPVLTDRQLQAAIRRNGCLEVADEGIQQPAEGMPIPIDAGGGEVAKAG
jgi:hypothetical protein